jgi:cytochrome o ubiquinol oxidase subunit 2
MQFSYYHAIKENRTARAGGAIALLSALGGCNAVVLHPAGDVARQQRDLLLMSTGLMLLIILPVMALTVLFAWRYRASNRAARYEPEWHHSMQLELVIWAAPLLIVMCLGALTWMGTHLLDPFRPIGRIAAGQPMPQAAKPLRIQVVALDWKFLFIYPDEGIATINDLAAPVDRPIDFQITSSSVMNSFYIPALAGQIYAMTGMETRLHAVINQAGDYEGFSANYSGAGFSGMHFRFHGLKTDDFASWLEKVRSSGTALDTAAYLELERPSMDVPVRGYASVAPALYHAVLNMCVEPGKMCMDDMMRIDAKGGLGLAGIRNTQPLAYDKYARRGEVRGTVMGPAPSYVASICAIGDASSGTPLPGVFARYSPASATMVGAGLASPGLLRITATVPGTLPGS